MHQRRPNILFMIADDHRHDALGAAGDPVVQTPVLDGLARGGVAFRQAHMMGSQIGAVCAPSRACLHTGTNLFHAWVRQGVHDDAGAIAFNPNLAILPAVLREAGYYTYAVGKWHNDKASFTRSFCGGSRLFFGGMSDHWHVPLHDFDHGEISPSDANPAMDTFSTELFVDAAIRFLQEYREHQPFYLYIAFTAPHDPRTPPGEYADRYHPDSIPLPANFLPEHPFDNGEMDVRDEQLAPWPRTPEVIRQHIADYYGMISDLDAQIGRVLAALATSGRAENTIVVYTADHGLAIGQHGLLGKQNVYNHSVRIPMLLSGPGLPVGREIDALTYLYDLFPTLCDLAGIPVPPTVEARSLMPLITGEQAQIREYVFSAYKDVQRMVSDGRWKLIRYYRSVERAVGTDRIQLFNLGEDPWETDDRAADLVQRARLGRLAEALATWQARVGDPLAGQPVLIAQ
jgi:arylsulfatase A-like enzyme